MDIPGLLGIGSWCQPLLGLRLSVPEGLSLLPEDSCFVGFWVVWALAFPYEVALKPSSLPTVGAGGGVDLPKGVPEAPHILLDLKCL